jgi:homoserine dehydrogenase
MVQAPEITEVTMSGPGAGGIETASAVLGDLVSVISGDAPVHQAKNDLPILSDVESSFYLHLEVADEPGVLAQVAKMLSDSGISVKSVVQKGMGNDARLVMVVHRCSETLFMDAVAQIAELGSLRSSPRFIRVIEEEF